MVRKLQKEGGYLGGGGVSYQPCFWHSPQLRIPSLPCARRPIPPLFLVPWQETTPLLRLESGSSWAEFTTLFGREELEYCAAGPGQSCRFRRKASLNLLTLG